MKKVVLCFFLIIFWNNQLQGQNRGAIPVKTKINGKIETLYNESHALLLGNSDYMNSYWEELNGVKNDIPKIEIALKNAGFNVITKLNLSKEELDKTISDFITSYGKNPENRLLFYYAGHGHTLTKKYGNSIGYIVPIDSPNPEKDESTFEAGAFEMKQIEIYAERIESKHALFLFDACFAGNLFSLRGDIPNIVTYKASLPVRQFITSGSANETVPDNSIFSIQFLKALSSKDADFNQDGFLTGTELGKFLQDNVVNYSYNTQ
ncbi:unnamed protein product, partial [Ectocarpus sp. 12 AP-2014]